MKKPSLQDQLLEAKKAAETASKKVQDIEAKIQVEAVKNKPKSIMDRVKTFADVLKIAKPTVEELKILNYKGKSKRIKFAADIMALALIHEVLNEGWLPKMGKDERWYVWFDVSSGFVFDDALCVDTIANTSSASRLCLKNEELAIHSGKIFTQYHKNVIM